MFPRLTDGWLRIGETAVANRRKDAIRPLRFVRLCRRSRLKVTLISGLLFLVAGCHQEMANQPRLDPLEASEVFESGRASRRLPPHVVATSSPQSEHGWSATDPTVQTGREDGKLIDRFPAALLEDRDHLDLLRRGRERFGIHCAPCHGLSGNGDGMVARRGFPFPPTYHAPRLREKPLGHFFNVITHGKGKMPSYADLISIEDRWAIAGYVRALQLSQYASIEMVETSQRNELMEER